MTVLANRWTAAPFELVRRSWDDEAVVYHAGSANTHVLNQTAVALLDLIQIRGMAVDAESCAAELAAQFAVEPTPAWQREVETLLAEFEDLGLVDRVS